MVNVNLKQCLQLLTMITVPCIRRARQMEYTEDEDQETQVDDENDDGESWMYTHSSRG